MNMKKTVLTISLTALLIMSMAVSYAGKTRKIHFIEDDAQSYMVSKVYELKYARAVDLTPFMLGAVLRYSPNSRVSRLKNTYAKKHFLLVTTAREMMPFVDDMVKKLDRPGIKQDEWGSIIEGTGIYRFAYSPKYRSTDDMVRIVHLGAGSGDGDVFRDASSNMIYWKDSASDGKNVIKWLRNLDRPVPQIELTVKVYTVRESDLRDVGIDYLAWKNGPGLEIFGFGFDSLNFRATEKLFSAALQKFADLSGNMSYAFGGFYTAPQFDASFVRCLEQSGNAKLAATASLTITNNYAKEFSIKFTPEYQNIIKDPDNDKSNVVVSENAEFELIINNPVICFENFAYKSRADGTIVHSKKDYETGNGNVIFDYHVEMNNVVERNNYGEELTDVSKVESSITLNLRTEKLLATWTKESDVEQLIGVPFLCKIPVVKYLFSTTTTIKEKNHLFVTVKGRLVHPESSLSEFAGKVIALSEVSDK
jgi:type II/III secretion system protein